MFAENLERGMRTVGSLSPRFGNVSKHGNKGQGTQREDK